MPLDSHFLLPRTIHSVYALGDWGFHQTRRLKYDDAKGTDAMANGLRVVFGAYCAQIDESNVAMIRHIYDGDDVSLLVCVMKHFLGR